MPELPEVETITTDLRKAVIGRKISAVRSLDEKTLRLAGGVSVTEAMVGLVITRARRQAKYILIDLSPEAEREPTLTLALHLAVNGQLLLVEPKVEVAPETRLVLTLSPEGEIRLLDESGYSRAVLGPEQSVIDLLGLDELGPEAISDNFTLEMFQSILRNRRGKLKPLLLDQKIVSGLGNIYVDEALFAARLHPERVAGSLSLEESERLYNAMRSALRSGIEHRGVTFDSYRDLFGQPGGHQSHLQVFQRTGKPCRVCGAKISRSAVGGRATYTCPNCQSLNPTPLFG